MSPPITVCVIDDDEFVRITICAALHFAGLGTAQAPEGAAGLVQIARTKAGIAIVDIFMPGKEGLETIGDIKANFPHVKVLAISGGGVIARAEVLSLASDLGADAYLAKPFRNEELVAKVKELIARDDARAHQASS
jgi:DNA-binding response OmpR family regulator